MTTKALNTHNRALKNFDVNLLDSFEFMQYSEYIQTMSKEEALQILINNVENDFSQLSEALQELAENLE